MAVAYIAQASVSEEEYRRVADEVGRGGPMEGHVLQVSGKAEDGTRWFVDVWESVEAAERFERERSVSRLRAASGQPRPGPDSD